MGELEVQEVVAARASVTTSAAPPSPPRWGALEVVEMAGMEELAGPVVTAVSEVREEAVTAAGSLSRPGASACPATPSTTIPRWVDEVALRAWVFTAV